MCATFPSLAARVFHEGLCLSAAAQGKVNGQRWVALFSSSCAVVNAGNTRGMMDARRKQAIMMASSRADRRYEMRKNDALYALGNAGDRREVMSGACVGRKSLSASSNDGCVWASWREGGEAFVTQNQRR